MPLPLHLWLPRAVVWIGVIIVTFQSALWWISEDHEFLGYMGGAWALCRVTQFLLMTRGAQAVLRWLGGCRAIAG